MRIMEGDNFEKARYLSWLNRQGIEYKVGHGKIYFRVENYAQILILPQH